MGPGKQEIPWETEVEGNPQGEGPQDGSCVAGRPVQAGQLALGDRAPIKEINGILKGH